jgi:membrane associated rhomboid family serine protease
MGYIKMSKEIDTESKLIWNILLQIILIPFRIIMIVFRKASVGDLFIPFKELYKFFIQSKFTISMIALNFLFFFVQIFSSDTFTLTLASYPTDLITPSRLFTLISSGFIHADISHILGNMLALLIFGRIVERKLGAGKTFLVYIASLIISSIFSNIIGLMQSSNIPGLGASGAIMGLVGISIILAPLQLSYIAIIPLPVMVLGWTMIWIDLSGILSNVQDGIGHYAHLGGYLSVSLIYYLLNSEDKSKLKKGILINLVSIAIIAGIYYLFIANKII